MGWGAVVRDHNGAFLLCCNEGLAALSAHKPAEVLAARQAPQLAKYHGYLKVVLTSDCLTLVQRLSSQVQDRSHVGTVISYIKALARGFETSSFKFASRNLNVVAHRLARSSLLSVCSILVVIVPDSIRDVLCNDLFVD
jgi:hypothetical protein